RWRCPACCGARRASSAGSPSARRGGRGRGCCGARWRRRSPRRRGRGRGWRGGPSREDGGKRARVKYAPLDSRSEPAHTTTRLPVHPRAASVARGVSLLRGARMAKRIARWLALASVIVPAYVLAARAPETRAAPASVVVADRALPLRHFNWSRATGTDAEGYYHQPAGLSDDFPEGTTAQKIERDLTTAAETGAEVFRFGMAWDHIEKE